MTQAARRAREITSFFILGAAAVGAILWGQACFNKAVVRANAEATHHEGAATQAAIYAESKARQVGDSIAAQSAAESDSEVHLELREIRRQITVNAETGRLDREILHKQVDSLLSIFRPAFVRPRALRR